MSQKQDILKDLHPQYFWDTDLNKLDSDRSRRLIIERVFSLGSFREIKIVINRYGNREVVSVLKNLKYIDPKTLNFISLFFKEPLDSFRCYKNRQLSRQHWDS
jgi:hypothetical protein